MTYIWLTIISFVITTYPSVVYSQNNEGDVPAIKLALKEDVESATRIAKLENQTAWIEAFNEIINSSDTELINLLEIPRERRVGQLVAYMRAKKIFYSEGGNNKFDVNINDFSWQYMQSDVGFFPIRLEGIQVAELTGITTGGATFGFNARVRRPLSANDKNYFIIPYFTSSKYSEVSASFRTDDRGANWTGYADWGSTERELERIEFHPVSFEKGIKLTVNSIPPGATIYVNKNLHYKPTNDTFVRPAGEQDIEIKMEGYQSWSKTKILTNGEIWTIDATLRPLPPNKETKE